MASIFYGWWIVLACFLIAFYAGGVLFYGFTTFFEPIVKEFGWSHTQVSVAFYLRGLEMGLLAPITGLLVDRFGPRKLIFSGTLMVGFALILLSLTKSLVMFYGSFVLMAFGTSGCASTVLMTTIAHWFRSHTGKAMGLVVCGFGAGGIIIPLIVWFIDVYQWRTTLIILGLGMWALGIPLSFVIRHKPEQYGYLPDGGIPSEPSCRHARRDIEEEVHFEEALKSGDFWKIGIPNALGEMVIIAVTTHCMPYLSSIGMSRVSASAVATSIPLMSIAGRFGFGWLGDVFDKRYVLAVAYCLFGMGTIAFSCIHVKWLILPFLFLFSPALGGIVSLMGATVREYFGRASFGKILGIMMGMVGIGGVVGTSVAGWTFDNLGGYHPVWVSFAGTTVIAIVLMLRLGAPRQIGEG